MATAAAKAMLSKSNDDGVSVYSHLTEVLATMLESKPADPLSALEAISTSVKASYYKPNAAPAGPPPTSVADAASSDAWQTASDKLLKVRPRSLSLPARAGAGYACRAGWAATGFTSPPQIALLVASCPQACADVTPFCPNGQAPSFTAPPPPPDENMVCCEGQLEVATHLS